MIIRMCAAPLSWRRHDAPTGNVKIDNVASLRAFLASEVSHRFLLLVARRQPHARERLQEMILRARIFLFQTLGICGRHPQRPATR